MTGLIDATPGARVWRLDLPMAKPLSLNDRRHHMAHAAMKKQVRLNAKNLALYAKIPALARIAIELHYCPRDSRRRDEINLVATLKPAEDGIVDAGVIPDDTKQWSQPTMPVLDAPSTLTTIRLYLLIRELPA